MAAEAARCLDPELLERGKAVLPGWPGGIYQGVRAHDLRPGQ